MTTKNLVPRANGEGKLGLKGSTNLNWKEVNAVSGSFDLTKTDELKNLDGNNLIVGGSGVTISHANGSNGYEYTISSAAGTGDQISEGQAKVETIDTGTDARIEFSVDTDGNGTSTKVWEFSQNGHLLPATNGDYDIGSAERKVRHLFLSDNTIFLGSDSDNSTPYRFGVDTTTDRFRVSTDSGSNFSNIALASDLTSYATQSFVTTQGYATQTYVNDAIQGLDAKEAADAATTAALTGFSYASNVFTESSATGALTIDGVVLSNNDRVLVKNQGSGNEVQNGIYVTSNIDGSSAVTLTRSADNSNTSDFDGAFVFVQNGSSNIGRSYVAKPTTSGQSTVGTHGMEWITFTSSNVTNLNTLNDVSFTAGSGIDGYALVYNHANTQWEAASTNPTILLSSSNVTRETSTNHALVDIASGTNYIIDPSVSSINQLSRIFLTVPLTGVSDPAVTKIVNLSTLPIIVRAASNNVLYDSLGSVAPYSTSSLAGWKLQYNKGTINLYQSDTTGTGAKWYSYFDYPVENQSEPSEGDGVAYSVIDRANINIGQVFGDFVLTGDVYQSSVRAGRRYVTADNETVNRTVSLPNVAQFEDVCEALNGSLLYFENRGTASLSVDPDLTDAPNSGYWAYVSKLDGSGATSGKLDLEPGESIAMRVERVSNNMYYRYIKQGFIPSRITETITSTSTISTGTEHHKVVYIDNGSTAVTITVPDSANNREGYQLTLKVLGSGAVTVNRSGSNTFDGSTSLTLGQNNQLTVIKSSAGWAILQNDAATGITELVQDTTPVLGGDLDVSTFDIVSSSNRNIEVSPNGSGLFVVKGNTTAGSGSITLNCENNSHGVKIQGPPHSAGATYSLTLPNTDGNANQVLKTDGSGNLDWVDQSSAGASALNGLSDVTITSPADNSILSYDNSNSVWIDNQSLDLTGIIKTSSAVTGSEMRLGGTARRFHTQTFTSTLGDGLSSQNTTSITSNDLITVLNAGSLGLAIIPQANDGSNTYNGTLKLYDGGDSSGDDRHYIALATPGKLSSSTTYSLPSDDGSSGDVLSTNGSGTLSWSTPSGGGGGGGSTTLSENTLSADLTIPTPTASRIVYVLTSSADRTVNLPAASGVTSGTVIDIKSVSNVTFTITPNGTDDLDTVSGDTFALSVQYSSITLICNGSDGWFII